MSAFGDGRPDSYHPYEPHEPNEPYAPAGEEHVPQHRRGSRLVLAVGVGVAALLVVGAATVGGSLLLGRFSSSSADTATVAGAASSESAGDPSADAFAEPDALGAAPSPAEATTASPAPGPTTSSAPAKTQTTPPAKPKTTAAVPANASYEAQVLAIANNERAKAGCKPLAANTKLATAARKHSADMAARDYFSHDTPEGVDFATRISNEGYRWSGAAENIAKGQRTPEEVMKAWMNSSGHRANILNCNLKDLGVGLAYQGKTAIWTQDFGTPR
ncbi:hypothetical protein GCM10010399_56680 [Dactylosporangium fulvum]|uniref:CAP domain-containing protein n=1 Tax=Dactylosporangium fulvum TaxID=53359 RepID=A0ABY5VUJ7_9ACTN|nr:CAP domain-containing protein [Dactylosporangium fulvum]UWP80862.1 CAP domain-containing protein [Dactylosporangium fulvum]